MIRSRELVVRAKRAFAATYVIILCLEHSINDKFKY